MTTGEARPQQGLYRRLGVREVINAATTLTAIGGSRMPAPVLSAMAEAAQSHVDLRELHEKVGQRVADLTGNESAYVTAGCAAGITLAVLACRTGGDPAAIGKVASGDGPRPEVVMHCCHRIPYDYAVALARARIVEVGNVIQTHRWELAAAISDRTAAVLFVAGEHLPQAALDLRTVVTVAHARGVPVIVDAAAQLPPRDNLWRFTRDLGADLVLFSGGKALRGPQCSGLMLGRADLVRGAAANASPNQLYARALKIGREEIVGLLRAVELFMALDVDAESRLWHRTIARWEQLLGETPGLVTRRCATNEAGQPVPRLHVGVEPSVAGMTVGELVDRLWDGDPRIAVLPDRTGFFLTPDTLTPDEAEAVAAAIVATVSRCGRRRNRPAPPGLGGPGGPAVR